MQVVRHSFGITLEELSFRVSASKYGYENRGNEMMIRRRTPMLLVLPSEAVKSSQRTSVQPHAPLEEAQGHQTEVVHDCHHACNRDGKRTRTTDAVRVRLRYSPRGRDCETVAS